MCAISSTLPLPVPVKRRDDVVARGRLAAETVSIVGAELLQLLGGDGADRFQPVGVAGAGIDVDQPLPELDRAGLVALPRCRGSACRLRLRRTGLAPAPTQQQQRQRRRPLPISSPSCRPLRERLLARPSRDAAARRAR